MNHCPILFMVVMGPPVTRTICRENDVLSARWTRSVVGEAANQILSPSRRVREQAFRCLVKVWFPDCGLMFVYVLKNKKEPLDRDGNGLFDANK